MRVIERAETKGVRISLLRNEAVLRDISKAGQRVNTAVHRIDFFSTGFRRLDSRSCRYSRYAAYNL